MYHKDLTGYIKIPEHQLILERKQKATNKTWHRNVMNLLLGKSVCASCLRMEHDLVHLDAAFVLSPQEHEMGEERSLRNMIISTFGRHVENIIPSTSLCQKCVDIIISAHLFTEALKINCKHIEQRLIEISHQMKWTQHLDETGSWNENINIKVIDDDELLRKINNNLFHVNIQNKVEKLETNKMHKIVFDNESLKSKLLKEPDMHKFLIMRHTLPTDDITEDKLPAGITVKKVSKSTDIPDFAPHDLLELNWAEEDSLKPDTSAPDSTLHSNEALIMNLMEQAKTVEKQIHFQENLNLNVNKNAQLPLAKDNNYNICNDSLSVQLIQTSTANQNYICSDNNEIVPQDLLELKWPEEQTYDTTLTKIPLKKLNFNEALTVKFIPSHKLQRDQNNTGDIAPHELLELNWNEEVETQNDNLPSKQSDLKHNIDLTQWLQDQGLSTIKTETLNTEPNITNMVNINEPSVSMNGTSNNDPINDLIECNIIFKQSAPVIGSNEGTIRCALCDLKFIQFESYQDHYRTHKVTETAKCYRCPGIFPVIELLIEHLLLMHSEDKAYCTLCYALLNQDKLARHMVDNHAKKVEIINASLSTQKPVETRCKKCHESLLNSTNNPHICVFRLDCPECKGECDHKKYIASYIMQLKANKKKFQCIDCDYQYKTKQDIIWHVNNAHLKLVSYHCKLCNGKFLRHSDLVEHKDKSHFRCEDCRKVYLDQIHLDNHNCSMLFIKDLKCKVCGVQMVDKYALIHHMVSTHHQGEEQCTVCKVCGEQMVDKYALIHHMVSTHHQGEEQCTVCKRYIKKELLEEHFQSHDIEDTLMCPHCNLVCENQNQFEVHVNRFHLLIRPYQCDLCKKSFYGKQKLRLHVRQHYSQSRTEKCTFCNKKFARKVTLQKHMKLHTIKGQLFDCDLCEKRFISPALLNKHRKTHKNNSDAPKPRTSQN